MRILILVFSFLLALVGLPPAKAQAPARPAPTGHWLGKVVFAPDGGIVVGNPAAKVQLTEWLSYTCSHCADFARESKADLRALVSAGTVRVEYRTLPRDALDLTAALLVRCGGPARFVAAHDAVFGQQAAFLNKAQAFAQTPAAQAPAATIAIRLNQLAAATGLGELMRGHGLTDARIATCLNDEAAQKRVIALAQSAQANNIDSTPSFSVNGRRVEVHGWAELKPLLVAAP
jgi:protein-disulfide isomerase